MSRQWTGAQQAAMNERNRTLLVSAAAGSGKTAVLTERIIRSLTDSESPADISRILIVTFTRAATGELRQRISSALSSALALDPTNSHLQRQLMLLGSAHISTIDSFYLDLVRANFQAAGFPPTFRLADETELLSLRRDLMNEAIDDMYVSTPRFSLISDIFCDIRSESSLTEILLSIFDRLSKLPESIDILLRSANELEAGASTPLETTWGEVYLDEVTRIAARGVSLFDQAIRVFGDPTKDNKKGQKFTPLYAEIKNRCQSILDAARAREYPRLRELLLAPFEKTLGRQKTDELSDEERAIRALCDDFRSTSRWKNGTALLGCFSPEEIAQGAIESAEALRLLHEALHRFCGAYQAAKLARSVAEFSDVSRAAYRLLIKDGEPTPLAREISLRYDAIYIDEYQDVDAMQDATFRAISTPRNRFMVGDIKQSIYRFRGAQPAIFASYRKRFPALENAPSDAEAATVFMSNCFRCDKPIIDFSNTVSGFLFESSAESIAYTSEDDLVFSKLSPTPEHQPTKCRVLLVDRLSKEERDEDTPSNAEAELVADEIALLLEGERKADGSRITPSDIAVLMRSTKHAAPIARALAARGIASNDTSRFNFFESPEVLCMYSLLATIDNPFRDVYLAASLRSPFFGFTLEELIAIRSHSDRSLSLWEALLAFDRQDSPLAQKLSDCINRLALFRQKARTLPVDRLLRYLYRETAILSFTGYEDAPKSTKTARRANLRRLYEYARSFEANGFKGLGQFVTYIDDIMANGTKIPAAEGEANAVSLITVHHSKGLEYPVCFLVGTASALNRDDIKPALLADEHLGCSLRLPNAGPFSRTNTFHRRATALSLLRQNREEEMRVLYVALTRARERLIVTGNPQGGVDRLLERVQGAAVLPRELFFDTGNSYLEWILTALYTTDFSEFAEIETVFEGDLEARTLQENRESAQDDEKDRVLAETLRERFDFTYPHAHLTKLPAKLSVSRLSPVALDVFDSDGSPSPEEVLAPDAERLLHSFERTPTFGKKPPDAATRGTATHEFLQFCDFANVERTGVAAELDRLIEQRFLPEESREAIRQDELERFFESELYASLKTARELRRETRFHIFLPAASFTADPDFAGRLEGERLPIQGVIDLFYTDADGKLILCDYKTDRLSREELQDKRLAAELLTERHAQQLSYYALALRELCGRLPDKVLIYSLPLGDAIEVNLPKL